MNTESKANSGNRNELTSISINPEKKRADFITLIENEIHMGSGSKADLLLTYKGIKPAALISFSYKTDADSVEIQLQNSITSLRRILSVGKLPYRTQKYIDKEEGYIGATFYIGKDKQSLQNLLKANETDNLKNIGLALGYPKTAADAFNKGFHYVLTNPLTLSQNDLQWYCKSYWNFSFFALSKSHWREEAKQIENWSSVIKETSPKLYREMLSR